ncbi:hypothetical protein DPSP01_007671 [Paraphaeosphaeria sporulosa]
MRLCTEEEKAACNSMRKYELRGYLRCRWSIWLFQLNHRWNADTKVEAPSMKRPRKWLSLPPDGQSTMAASMIFDQTQFMCIVDPKAGVMQCVYKFEDIRRQKKTAGENSTGAALQIY